MSQENVEVMRGFYSLAESFLPTAAAAAVAEAALEDVAEAARGQRAVQQLMELMDEKIVWEPIFATTPYHGHDGVIRAIADWMAVMDDWHWVSYDFTDLGEDAVLANVTTRQRGKGSGIVTEQEVSIIYTLRGGKICGYKEFGDRASALAAHAAPG